MAISFDMFAGLTPKEIRGAFSGEYGLAKFWEPFGAGADQTLTLTLAYTKRTVLVFCQNKEVCVSGEWQSQSVWRTDLRDPKDKVVSPYLKVQGNVGAGFGRSDESYLDEIVAYFQKKQGEVRSLMSAKEAYDKYQRDCKAGRR